MIKLQSENKPEKGLNMNGNMMNSLKTKTNDMVQVKDYVFNMDSILGKGKMSMVYKAVDLRTNQVVAVKKVNNKTLNSEYLVTSLLNEISIHTKFQHPNIVQLLDVVRTTNNIYLILDYCNQGTLRDYMKRKGRVDEKEARLILNQLVQGIDVLLSNDIIHRDIKPENILCHVESEKLSFKICDFGFSKVLGEKNELLQSAIGSPQYMDLQRLSSEEYSTKSDVFSLGIIIYELLFGCPPWVANHWHELKLDLLSKPLNIPQGVVSKEMEEFIVRTLAIHESDRASWDDVRKFANLKKPSY